LQFQPGKAEHDDRAVIIRNYRAEEGGIAVTAAFHEMVDLILTD
jgi:hypothetical protein